MFKQLRNIVKLKEQAGTTINRDFWDYGTKFDRSNSILMNSEQNSANQGIWLELKINRKEKHNGSYKWNG